ncbi:chaperone protein dnaJ 20, chloroplastic-like [Aristolochia californica]|uniref:chaperone protein dnaJ 20, chloroplastic-like n=1 Tax=Aristolochia californica TaxID=171875 RepID=UPI0035DD5D10
MAIITPSSCLWKRSKKMNAISCRGRTVSEGKEGRNLYKVLRLESENVGFDEIKKAYRTMALQWHPDVCLASKREESTRKFLELKQAYETLSDPLSRMTYDAQLHSGSSTEQSERSFCSKQVWEAQLSELKRRSNERLQRKNKNMLV